MSNITPFKGETPENFDTRLHCVLVLDTSSSMEGPPINELNKGLIEFGNYLKADDATRYGVEISIITFNSIVECVQEPALVDNLSTTYNFPLKAIGTTKLVDGVRAAIKKVEDRKQWYKINKLEYYRPWIVLITDGFPDKDQNIDELAQEVELGAKGKHFAFLPMGTQGSDQQTLTRIAKGGFSPLPIDWKKFDEFFSWLSSSINAGMNSKDGKVKFEPVSSFARDGWGGMDDFTQTLI